MTQLSKWKTAEQIEDLVCELVGWHSRTGTQGEIDFPYKLKNKLLELAYFQKNESHIHFHDAGNNRHAVTALYQAENIKDTVVLMSHFDTVHTDEFGSLGHLAFNPRTLTEALKDSKERLPKDAQKDLESGEYLFGRGIMDMKMGLALHMQLLEKAILEQWPINIMLVSVPDEEVNSAGMRTSVKGLVELQKKFHLTYRLFLNSEPSFSQKPSDDSYYVYSGSIGKLMPSALFYGIETHAGEPLSGMTGHYMASYVTKAVEFNADFVEEAYGEKTPLPVTLKKYDLKEDYSTQTSHHAAALYNVFVMKKNAAETMETFKNTVENAIHTCQKDYESICKRENIKPIGDIRVITYADLLTYAEETLGVELVEKIKMKVREDKSLDEREMSIKLCDELMLYCKELAPATVIFFAPPYYPAVNSSDNRLVQELIEVTQTTLRSNFNIEAKQVHYFNGISDLSYVNYDQHDSGWKNYVKNTPVWGDVYDVPFVEMQQLQAPVFNIGPFGKDAHKLTERLHKQSGFVYTPYVLEKVMKKMFQSRYS